MSRGGEIFNVGRFVRRADSGERYVDLPLKSRGSTGWKIVVGFLIAVAFVLPMRADMLFWTVDFAAADKESPWTNPSMAPQVWLVASTDPVSGKDGTRLTLQNGAQSVLLPDGNSMGGLITAADISGYDSAAYTFFVEMGAVTGQADYTSAGVSYNDLVSNGFVSGGWSSMDDFWNASFSAWTPTHDDVPEPTGGVLTLIGAALLALRRRQWCDQRGSGFPAASEKRCPPCLRSDEDVVSPLVG